MIPYTIEIKKQSIGLFSLLLVLIIQSCSPAPYARLSSGTKSYHVSNSLKPQSSEIHSTDFSLETQTNEIIIPDLEATTNLSPGNLVAFQPFEDNEKGVSKESVIIKKTSSNVSLNDVHSKKLKRVKPISKVKLLKKMLFNPESITVDSNYLYLAGITLLVLLLALLSSSLGFWAIVGIMAGAFLILPAIISLLFTSLGLGLPTGQ